MAYDKGNKSTLIDALLLQLLTPQIMQEQAPSKDPLHGLSLEKMVTHLYESYGWEELTNQIHINCFSSNPSIQSSLKFLRKTPWARTKVEDFYKYSLRKKLLK